MSKEEILQEQGSWNPNWIKVKAQLFMSGDFFDAKDVIQVKYEMLRQVREDKVSVAKAATDFGFSRVRFYQIQRDFEKNGIAGLFPRKKGPQRAHKLTDEAMERIEHYISSKDMTKSEDLAIALKKDLEVSVHPRSIERALERRKKKRL